MEFSKANSIAALFTFLLFTLALSLPSYAVIGTVKGAVSKVSDDDTLHVITEKGKYLKIKLYGCDAPEIEKRNKQTGQITILGQPYSEEAKQALKKTRSIRKRFVWISLTLTVTIGWHH